MYFLLNDKILEVGAVQETLNQLGSLLPPGGLTPARAVALGREAAFACGGIENAKDDVRLLVCAAIVAATDANAAVFVCPPKARNASEVASRLGRVPLLTMARLMDAQSAGKLTPAVINAYVWSLAGEAQAS